MAPSWLADQRALDYKKEEHKSLNLLENKRQPNPNQTPTEFAVCLCPSVLAYSEFLWSLPCLSGWLVLFRAKWLIVEALKDKNRRSFPIFSTALLKMAKFLFNLVAFLPHLQSFHLFLLCFGATQLSQKSIEFSGIGHHDVGFHQPLREPQRTCF